jgi:hypothetical protein
MEEGIQYEERYYNCLKMLDFMLPQGIYQRLQLDWLDFLTAEGTSMQDVVDDFCNYWHESRAMHSLVMDVHPLSTEEYQGWWVKLVS